MATATQFEPVLNATPATEYFSVLGVGVDAVQILDVGRPASTTAFYGHPYCLKAIEPGQVIQGISAPTKEIWGAMPRAVKKSVEAAASS
jgi:hypothetical protein